MLEIDDDILQAAGDIAAAECISIGAAVSRLARTGMHKKGSEEASFQVKGGIPIFPARKGEVITVDHVRQLMEMTEEQ